MKNKRILISSLLAMTMMVVSGCSSKSSNVQDNLSAAEQTRLKQALLKKIRMQLNMPSERHEEKQKEDSTPVKEVANVSESELLSKIEKLPLSQKGVKFTKRRDGFVIDNKQSYIDPEGSITNYGYNWKDGSFCYAIKVAPNSYKIKYNTAVNPGEAVDIATMQREGNTYAVTTVSGKKLNGKGIIMTSKGFIVVRDATAFNYVIGKGIQTFVAPQGWHIASFQNGDVASTNFILLERDPATTSSSSLNPFADLIKSTKELGNAFGVIEKKDYMLVSLQNPDKKYKLNITLGEKEVALYSQCRQTSRYYQQCDQMDMRESLYSPNGLKNFNHYYWNITWFSGKNKIFAVVKEGNNRNVNVLDLQTGKKVTVASRVTGFPEFEAIQDNTGTVKLHVAGGFLPSVDVTNVEQKLTEKMQTVAKK